MKNKYIILIGIILVIAIVSIVVFINNNKKEDNNVKTIELINAINNNISKYESSDEKLQEYEKINNYMSNDFKDEDISFSYYGYPNDESEYYLGSILLFTNKYNILGVTIGDNMKTAIDKLKNYGFKLEESNNNFISILNYEDFTVKIEANTNSYEESEDEVIIGTIQLEVKSKYLGNRTY